MAATTKAYILIECSMGTTKEVVTGLKKLKGIKSVETVTGPGGSSGSEIDITAQ
jgi:hypothetical protein